MNINLRRVGFQNRNIADGGMRIVDERLMAKPAPEAVDRQLHVSKRGIIVSYEVIQRWPRKFGAAAEKLLGGFCCKRPL